MSLSNRDAAEKSAVQIRLLKGPLYRAKQAALWQCLERDQFQIREYFQQIGLALRMDDAEGYAFLKQQDIDPDEGAGGGEGGNEGEGPGQGRIEIPRLITRRALSFAHTLLLVLLRKRLAEHDTQESSPRLMVSRNEIEQWLQPYFVTVGNEIKQSRDFAALIKKVIDMGFLTALPSHQDEFEVQRIIKAVVNAEQIATMLEKLQQHAQQHAQQ